MNFPRWRQSLVRSLHLHRSKPEAKYFQIASIGADNFVNNRTMVFRGFVDESLDILAVTDSRSDKIKDWSKQPKAQICWYFPKSKEQYRISVDVTLYPNKTNSLRKNLWDQLSPNAKSQFFWPSPKVPLEESHKSSNQDQYLDVKSCEHFNDIPSNFIALRFTPQYIDYLNLSDLPQTREIYDLVNSEWIFSKVNP